MVSAEISLLGKVVGVDKLICGRAGEAWMQEQARWRRIMAGGRRDADNVRFRPHPNLRPAERGRGQR